MTRRIAAILALIVLFSTPLAAHAADKKASGSKPAQILFEIEQDGRIGFIDGTGKVVVMPQFKKRPAAVLPKASCGSNRTGAGATWRTPAG